MKKISFLLLIILLIGCTPSQNDIKLKLLEVNKEIKSYNFNLESNITLTTTISGKTIRLSSETYANGEVDRVNKKLFFNAKVSSNTLGKIQELHSTNFIIDDYIYTQVASQWVKIKINQSLWDQQDKLSQVLSFMLSGSITQLGDETIDGITYSVVELNPSKELIENYAKSEQTEILNKIAKYQMEVTDFTTMVWVNKKTFVVEKALTSMQLKISAENPVNPSQKQELIASVVTLFSIADIDKEIDITLSPDAINALDLQSVQDNAQKWAIDKTEATLKDHCTFTKTEELTCTKKWIVSLNSIEYNLSANTSLSIPKSTGMLAAFVDPEYDFPSDPEEMKKMIQDPNDPGRLHVFLAYLNIGQIEINRNASNNAVKSMFNVTAAVNESSTS